jgi:hypothetical protein
MGETASGNQATGTSSPEQTPTTNTTNQETTGAQTTEGQSSNPIADAMATEVPNGQGDTSNNVDDANNNPPADNGAVDNPDGDKGDAPTEGYELELSEDSPLSDEDFDAIVAEANEFKLTKEQAESRIKQAESLYTKGQQDAYKPRMEYYKNQVDLFNKDPDFNGDNKAAAYLSIKKAVDKFGDPELLAQLSSPEIGNNYALAKFLKKIGDSVGVDNPAHQGKGVAGAPAEIDPYQQSLRNLYPDFF